jgi:hypothetical protein
MRYLLVFVAVCVLCAPSVCLAQWASPDKSQGFLCRPPVFVPNEPDFPLTGLGVLMPDPGVTVPDVDLSGQSSNRWFHDGHNVQPSLRLTQSWIRVGALRGFRGGWAAGISIPWYRNQVFGSMGGNVTQAIPEGVGNILLGAKKVIWQDKCQIQRVIIGGGVELPTGKDNAIFGPTNVATTGYYGASQRVPLGWQPSTGAWNGLAALAYGHYYKRLSWEFLLACKINGTGDQDVHVGNTLITALTGTYGISKNLAGTVGLTLRAQGDDDYPNSPIPVNSFPLTATTTHSSLLYLDLGVRYVIMDKVVIGIAARTPINQPDEGMDPTTQISWIFYPSM